MIIVTHEMSFAQEISDKVVFMDGGVVVEKRHPFRYFRKSSKRTHDTVSSAISAKRRRIKMDNKITFIEADEVYRELTMQECIPLMSEAMRNFSDGKYIQPLRTVHISASQ